MAIETLSFGTAGGETTAYVAAPDAPNGRAVILIQEWWGLNEHIKDIARRYAAEGFTAIAPDLYRGRLATNPQEAGEMMQALKIDDGIDTIKNAIDAAREKYGFEHFGISGYCMGGTYSLRAACLLEGISAAAPFYGDVPEEEVLKNLTAPTVFVSGTKDKWINAEKVGYLLEMTEKYELPVTSVSYEADHAFFNDTRPEVYDETAAQDAWAKVLALFNDKL
ncbi:MAG: dienelactone hydrolase family protein [Acidobacteria bacterium]|nr:dienelactone hydrolase family protein [Acidobacteriota bacterium]